MWWSGRVVGGGGGSRGGWGGEEVLRRRRVCECARVCGRGKGGRAGPEGRVSGMLLLGGIDEQQCGFHWGTKTAARRQNMKNCRGLSRKIWGFSLRVQSSCCFSPLLSLPAFTRHTTHHTHLTNAPTHDRQEPSARAKRLPRARGRGVAHEKFSSFSLLFLLCWLQASSLCVPPF